MKCPREFYLNLDVVEFAKELIGKYLFTKINGKISAGMITETEAYNGIVDKACHAYNGRHTERTKVMYEQGGTAYVYIIYGIHYLFNIVVNEPGNPQAVLIRAVKPEIGTDFMEERRNIKHTKANFSSGPGTLAKALGIRKEHNGIDLTGNEIWIEDKEIKIDESKIYNTKRIGIDYAEEDADLLYRFVYKP